MIRDYVKVPEALVLVGLALAAAIFGWVQANVHLDRTPVRARGSIAWELPELRENDSAAARRQLTGQPIWGQSGPAKSASKSPKSVEPEDSWKLLGIVAEGNGLYALMKPGRNAKATLLGPGDTLPDGSVIETLDKVSVTTVKLGEKTIHRLFGGNS